MASERVPVRAKVVPVRTERFPVRTQQVLMRYVGGSLTGWNRNRANNWLGLKKLNH
jgi:hypothetical protein